MGFRDIPQPFICCVLIDDPSPDGVTRTMKLAEYEGADVMMAMRAFFSNADFRVTRRAEWFLPPEVLEAGLEEQMARVVASEGTGASPVAVVAHPGGDQESSRGVGA